MKGIKSEVMLIVVIILLVVTAAVLSVNIIFARKGAEVSDNAAARSVKFPRQENLVSFQEKSVVIEQDSCFETVPSVSLYYEKKDAYTTPYGVFKPIDAIMEKNEYMTINPTILDSELSLCYITPDGDKSKAREIMSQVSKLSDEICEGLKTDYERVRALSGWVGSNIYYDMDAAHNSVDLSITSLEAVIGNGYKTTCAGFANMFSALCHCQGIYCLNMKGGTASDGWSRDQLEEAPTNHEWNAVVLDGQWYYVDCTWISDASVIDGEPTEALYYLEMYELFGFGEMCIEHRIDKCEHRCYGIETK